MSALAVENVSLERQGHPVIGGLSLASSARSVVLLGAPTELGTAVAGISLPRSGAIRWDGDAARDRLSRGEVAYAPLDAPLPPKWSVRRALAEIATLADPDGVPGRVESALTRMELTASSDKAVGTLPLLVRRAVAIAGLLASGARVIVFEDNTELRGFVRGAPMPKEEWLSVEAAQWLAQLTSKALDGLTWMVLSSAPETPFRPLADELIVLSGSQVAYQGDTGGPRASSLFVVRILENAPAFSNAMRELGGSVTTSEGGRAFVRTGSGWTAVQLLRTAHQAGALILDVEPLLTFAKEGAQART